MKENKYWNNGNCLNHVLDGFKDFKDLKSVNTINLCHLSNPRKSVIQTTISENFKELAL